jgi:hypothetical protein
MHNARERAFLRLRAAVDLIRHGEIVTRATCPRTIVRQPQSADFHLRPYECANCGTALAIP